MSSLFRLPFVATVALFFAACSGSETNQNAKSLSDIDEKLIHANKKLVRTESEQIDDFAARYNWKMQMTGTGLRYLIYVKGNGPGAEAGKIARIGYTVSLLTGEICYSSQEKGPREFIIGRGGVESGLEEGILILRTGDRAKFILPSHLAFGLAGDGDKIPAKAVLVYDVELLELK
ncbi:MAG: peptidylprolyl isomerase [Bacteroidetes bacterium]|nr:peptidylprolyl isomerase [Bacteroidota bacterium]